jgi:hypothetical protein
LSINNNMKITEIINEASFSFDSEDFAYTENSTVSYEDRIKFAEYIARQMDIMGISNEEAAQLYRDAKEGSDGWIHDLGNDDRFTKLTGHGIATAQTSNMIAVMNAAGLLGGVLRITPVKKQQSPTPWVDDDAQHDDPDSRDRKQAAMFRSYGNDPSGARTYR